jgi:hypothetical protein
MNISVLRNASGDPAGWATMRRCEERGCGHDDLADVHPHEEAAMKRTRKQDQERPQRPGGTARGLAEADLALVVGGDLYLHNPRWGSDWPAG